LGRVWCGGIDANAEQVRRGLGLDFREVAAAGPPLYGLESALIHVATMPVI
jgi:hypothetical protein